MNSSSTERIQCDNCRSFKLIIYDRRLKLVYGLGFLALGALGCVMFNYGGVLVLMGIIGGGCVFIGVAYLIMAAAHQKTKIRCKSCGNQWKLT
jgi:DNA-directed RNA polymerase subunit RPC12/RpoP